MALLYDLPTQESLDNWQQIIVLLVPLGMKEIIFEESTPKKYYLEQGYKEFKIGIAPGERLQLIGHRLQARHKQYGLKHRIASTIHGSMGDTEPQIASDISAADPNYRLWEKGQLIVLVSRTRLGIDTIFVGDKTETLKALKTLLIKKTMWTGYMENYCQSLH